MKENILKIIELIQPWLLSQGIKILLIVTIAFIINKLKNKFIEKTVRAAVKPGDHSSKDAEIKREDTLIRIFKGLINILIITIAFIMILNEIGVQVGPILAGAGIIGLAIGFGGQYLIKDLITGFFLLLENQYRIGDVVEIDKTGGLVEDISLRMTTLRDLNGTIHHIPHGDIKRVSNLSKKFARVNLNIGVSYSSNMEHVIKTVNDTGNKLAEDPAWKEHIILAPQFLRVDDFADSAIIIKILGETKPLMQWDVTGELRKRILIAFHAENIEIPFPQMVVHKKPEIFADIRARSL
jgi:moderate conductance mechanosensitive channel